MIVQDSDYDDTDYDDAVFYLTKERQGLYICNIKIKSIEEVQDKIKQFTIFDFFKED